MAPGHMIPMIDIAKLLAQRGVTVSIITTPQNANRFTSTIDRAVKSGLQIQLIQIRFPSVEAGLPEGCENLDTLPSLDMATNFFVALNLLQKEVGQVFDEMLPRPNCLISDMGLPWTTQIAEKLHIPRIVFHGTCCLSLLCSHNIRASEILDTLDSDSDYFEVPNLPDRIILRKSQVAGSTSKKSEVLKDVTDQIRAAEKTSYGVVVNSFEDLEPEYVKGYSKAKGEKVWCVGPVSLCNKDSLDLSHRGNKASIDEQDCLKWLDLHEPKSVIYASLGSLARLTVEQMSELALGLVALNRPFVWALGGGKSDSLEKWFSENGFEKGFQTEGRRAVSATSPCQCFLYLLVMSWNKTCVIPLRHWTRLTLPPDRVASSTIPLSGSVFHVSVKPRPSLTCLGPPRPVSPFGWVRMGANFRLFMR
ncbi:hypothetical protein DH2020_026207 [Rehmannia glutinosa]|uniref:UDP-glycosyltransferase n=1 Tax=Rehmannia glutinosa TaxID=99300 RepID=A0ABR0VXM5_REHGL